MKIKEGLKNYSKWMVYEIYERIVYNSKDYEKVSKNKMIESILKEYNQEGYLYFICTDKELEYLKKFHKKKPTLKQCIEYGDEMENLKNKCIISRMDNQVFEEQKENVEAALKMMNKRSDQSFDKVAIYAISILKIHANMLEKTFRSIILSMFHFNEEQLNALYSNPLFHYYCGSYYEWMESFNTEEEFMFYRDYYDLIDIIDDQRKIYGMAGVRTCDIRDNFDIFYYGFPIRNEKVKKMYDHFHGDIIGNHLLEMIERIRLLNNLDIMENIFKEEDISIIKEGLDESPCAIMNGFTPREYRERKEEEQELDVKFTSIPQNNAHIHKDLQDLYYKLYFALLEYTNNKYKIREDIKKIYKQEGLDANKLKDIDEVLWEKKEIIINQFIEENLYHFNKDELNDIKGFKRSIRSDQFVIVGFEKEYTKILSLKEGKIYMVKGIRGDIQKIVRGDLPIIITTTLLMFKDKIIYNGFFSEINLRFGNELKKEIIKEMKSAMTYYHIDEE